jgi:hypothetical protein
MLFHFLTRNRKDEFAMTQTRRRPRTSARQATSRRLMLESLEARTLLNGSSALATAYGRLPLAFEANQGQAAPQIDFLNQGNGYTLSLTPTGAVLDLPPMPGVMGQASGHEELQLQLVGANPTPQVLGQHELITETNYLIGSDPSQWHTNIANYGPVEYQNVYPGVNLVYYGHQGQLEYDFRVAPGANPGFIAESIQGAQSIALDGQGNLVLHTPGGDIVEQAPVLYQEIGGAHRAVPGRFVLEGNNQVGFQVGAYDSSRPLVIDPVLSYSTYLNSSGNTGAGVAIAVDSTGDAYITGTTTLSSATATILGHGVFVDKLNAGGTALVYQTLLGNNDAGGASGIAVDAAGDAYVTGLPGSSFPTTANAFQPTRPAGATGFVSVLDPTGTTLLYSSFLPGAATGTFGSSYPYAFWTAGPTVALDNAGTGNGLLDNMYLTGETVGGLTVTPGAFQASYAGTSGLPNAFFAQLNPNLSGAASLLYSTYLGGSGGANGTGIAVDGSNNAYVVGVAFANLPTTAGAFETTLGGAAYDAFVAKFNPALSGAASLVYSTYLGGNSGATGDLVDAQVISSQQEGPAIAVDGAGNAYVTGVTTSASFPTTPGAF